MSSSLHQSPVNCWLFCHVVDNFGDIGISWRLALSLQQELNWQIHLWIDDVAALQVIYPENISLPCLHKNIHLHYWQVGLKVDDLSTTPFPDIVIETFACDLPESVLDIIRKKKSLWLNWEYLSAEEKFERSHAMPSLQADGLQKYFWFMGFSDKSGGLLREKNYKELSLVNNTNWRHKLCLPEKTSPEWLLFGYKSAVWAEWLRMWQQANQPITLLLTGNQVIDALKTAKLLPNHTLLQDGDSFTLDTVNLIKIPYVAQYDFDRLLNLADGLIVRGEDSFVRAQFASKPFFWHIYPQEENIHIQKLTAFWQRAYPYYDKNICAAHQILSEELNGAYLLCPDLRLKAWMTLQNHWQEWQQSSKNWQTFLFNQTTAIEKLAKFAQDKLE